MPALKKLGIEEKRYQKAGYSDNQEQTKNTFGFKWAIRDSYDSDAAKKRVKDWLIERYCDNKEEAVKDWLVGGDKIILDAGCGSGLSALLLFGKELNYNNYLGVDISDSVGVAEERFKEEGIKGEFLQASILDLPFADETVDIIFSEGVLHHTDSTEDALIYLSRKLKKGGIFMFYVYAKKSVIREFTDDYIREKLSTMTDEEAWEALKPLTKLGQEMGRLNVKLNVPDDIPFLGIKRGEVDLQRFIYWNIFKAYYRPEYTLDEMNHLNFDWFRPLNCRRHTEDEIREYCRKANLEIELFNKQEAGFTVIARKK
ncbi:MAG: class I SAM-dependent methyltransferase [Ignavibacteriae bacterium]|nr:class I SAM-dependent methyltransferase [Ignavibacteriota bacterium]